jgi:hypothetical protein
MVEVEVPEEIEDNRMEIKNRNLATNINHQVVQSFLESWADEKGRFWSDSKQSSQKL